MGTATRLVQEQGEALMRRDHQFSWITRPNEIPCPHLWDAEIRSFPRFGVVASMGALVKGWLLVVPRQFHMNLRLLEDADRQDLVRIVQTLSRELEQFGGNVFIFEHGAVSESSSVACGVDQAHLHVVPLPFDLIEASVRRGRIERITFKEIGKTNDPWYKVRANHEYLLVQRQSDMHAMVSFPTHTTSQWFRKVIAAELNDADRWDYRRYPCYDAMLATRVALE